MAAETPWLFLIKKVELVLSKKWAKYLLGNQNTQISKGLGIVDQRPTRKEPKEWLQRLVNENLPWSKNDGQKL